MEHIKRRSRSNSSSDNSEDSKRQKIQTTTDETNCSSEETVSHFEDLSNELLYEIFEYLDYFHVYEAFFNLNIRFHYLLTRSNLPLKINLPLMSKSTLKRYNTDVIQANIRRINSFCLSNELSYVVDFLSLYRLSEFCQMETLILHGIESAYLENLLDQLSLSLLSSLVITSVDPIENKNTIYRRIFRLPALKYCKLSLRPLVSWEDRDNESLPVSTNEYSTIEHLIITHYIYPDQLGRLLSYIPQIRRLSVRLQESFLQKWTRIFPFVLNHLTHISLELNLLEFDRFQEVAIDLFSNIQVLHLSGSGDMDQAYLDSNKWKQLIISHLPNLRIFDIELGSYASNGYVQLRIENEINQFTSPFWIERQWFFAHHFYQARYGHRVIFYSTNPYRKKHYTLYKQLNETTSLDYSDSNINSVEHLYIQGEKSMMNCTHYFPNAAELTFKYGFSTNRTSLSSILNRIISLNQLTKLAIECHHFSFKKMIELLRFTPHLHTLIFRSMPFYKNDSLSIEESETFRLVSNTNTITKLTFTDRCTLEKLQLLLTLCPRVEHLRITTLVKNLDSITRFLLNKTNPNTRRLCLLSFSRANNNWLEKLDSLIKSETLINAYTLKLIDSKLYLCW